MPKASIDENRHPRTSEDNIGLAAERTERPNMHAKT
jgi:hypothetical protein